jgi:hypothetical protein
MRIPLPLPLAVALIIPAAASAQPSARAGMGIKAGGQWSTLLASDVTYTSIPGGLAGVYFPLLAAARLEIQPELLLSYQGCDVQRPEENLSRLRMLYVHLPVCAKLFLTNELNLQGGFQAGKCLSARMDDEGVTDDFRPFDVGFIAGLGVDLRSGFDIAARYYGGTTPVLTETTGVNPRHRLLQLTAGYRILRFSHRRHKLRKG